MRDEKANLSDILAIISPSLDFNLDKSNVIRVNKREEEKGKVNLCIMFDTMGICQELAISYHKSTAIEEEKDY